MEIEVSSRNMDFLECLSSQTRVKMIELLGKQAMNIKSLSESLDIKSPIVTRHIHMLENAGIVRCENLPGQRGTQKLCYLDMSHVTLRFNGNRQEEEPRSRDSVSLPVGTYSSYEVKPTCGLGSDQGMIGMCDDPRYFANPEHVHAKVLWFGSGFVE